MRSLLIAIAACFVAGKLHLFFAEGVEVGGDAEWYAYSVGLMLQQLIIGIALFVHIDYEDIGPKWAAFLICLFPIIEIALFFTGSPWWLGVATLISSGWLAWVSFRRYSVAPDKLGDDYIYLIAKRPNSFITFLASATGMPFGRYSYYFKGDVYHYHRNRFKKTHVSAFKMDEATIVRLDIRTSGVSRGTLEGLLGAKWGLFHNCLTVKFGDNNG